MTATTVGQLLVNAVLPEELRRPDRVLDKKGLQALLQEVADKHPDKYAQVLYDLSNIGHRAATATGGYSFGLAHLTPSDASRATQADLSQRSRAIYADDSLTPDQRREKVVAMLGDAGGPLQDAIYKDSLAADNPIAKQVLSGARGNKGNLRSLLGGDLLYVDHRDRPIPVPVLRSYGQGLSPAEYLAGTFGARTGVIATKMCLAYDTEVLMADGSAKEIQHVEVGDLVAGSDRTGQPSATRVVRVFDNGPRPCHYFTFGFRAEGDARVNRWYGETVVCTAEHRVLTYSPLRQAFETKAIGDRDVDFLVVQIQSGGSHLALPRLLVEDAGERATFDIEVEHPDHLFVLANGLVVSNSTQNAGYLGKQLIQASHRLVVTGLDADGDGQPDGPRGLPVAATDPDNEGALLAASAGGYERNTVLTPKILADIRAKGVEHLLVRSPLVGGPADGGVYARDVGVRERGGLAPVGDFVGIAAAQGASEPLSQSQLSSKHSGGVAGAAKGVTGFKRIDQLTQVPSTFPGGATHAQADGRITGVRPAPQGGHYVTVGNADHHVAQGMDPTVKVGDEVEAGDVLSEGLPNPAEIVRHKGIGEGRRYFTEAFRDAYAGAGIGLHRRNAELVARGLIDHVRMTEETDDHLPDDVVPYTRLEASWKPREGYDVGEPKRLLGHYLERPVLHYSIGTRLTPSVLRRLESHGVGSVAAHKSPPPFEPEMVRGMETVAHDADWMTRFMGSYLQRSLLRGVHRGDESDEAGSSYVPALARGQDFGRAGKTVGFAPPAPPKPPGPRSVLDGLL